MWSSFTPNSFSQTLYVGDSRDTLKLYSMIKAMQSQNQNLRKVPPAADPGAFSGKALIAPVEH